MGGVARNVRGTHGPRSGECSPDDRWGALLVPRELIEDHPRSRDRAFLLVRYTVVAAFFAFMFTPYFTLYLKLPQALLIMTLYEISLGLTLLILRWTRSQRFAANWTLSCAFAVLVFQASRLGGMSALAYPWLACLPVAAMLLRGVRGGTIWSGVSVLGIVAVGVADAIGVLPEGPTMSAAARGATMVTMAAVTMAMGALAWLAESRADELLHDLQAQKEMFEQRAVRDWLTGLANRSLLTECLIQSWERSRRHGPRGALFFLDLNDFKLVNDEHGHAAGDHVLREVALRLQETVRSSDLVGRLGGDEFGLIIEGVESHSDVAVIAEKIAEAIEQPIDLGEVHVKVGASLGVAFFPDRDCHVQDRIITSGGRASVPPPHGEVDHDSVRRLLEKADVAMYEAKRNDLRYWIHEDVAEATLRKSTKLVSEPPPAA